MRGKLYSKSHSASSSRITPADAGKTGYDNTFAVATPDHPRGCGENIDSKRLNRDKLGSPPRMRGKRSVSHHLRCEARITPADAGKTRRKLSMHGIGWDHPRGCGENDLPATAAYRMRGSPPRMRGKPLNARKAVAVRRITPADAGKTKLEKSDKKVYKDHPRGCGENLFMLVIFALPLGSPPRMRGKQRRSSSKKGGSRITPADAGKTGISLDSVYLF